MPKKERMRFTRREEQIMEILFRRGEASVADLEERLPGSPTSGAIRRLLNILQGKGAIQYRYDGPRKIYRATINKSRAGTQALRRVVDTFFGGSAASTMGALFSDKANELSSAEKKALSDLIRRAKREGR